MRIGTAAAPQVDAAIANVIGQEGQQAGMEGAFAQLLMQLFGSLELSGEPGEAQLPMQTAPAEDDAEDNAAAMQLMAELLASNGIPLPEAAQPSQEEAAGTIQTAGLPLENGTTAQLLAALAAQPEPVRQAANPSGKTQNAAVQKVFSELAAAKEETAVPVAQGIPAVVETSGTAGETALFDGQMQFRQSVAAAQKALKEEQKPSGSEPVDVEALQQKVDAERPGMTTALREKTYDFQQRSSVVNQMKEHVLKNLSEGNGEFTVKLKPESLGEITVKLTRNDGKISMSIVTASVQTAKLLNESAEALKSSLRPLQAEVREIIPRPEQASDARQSGFFGSGFESFQHQQQSTGREQPRYYSGPSYQQDAEAESMAEPLRNIPDGLDAYI